MSKYITIRNRFASFRVEKKPLAVIAVLCIILFLSMVLGLSIGSTWVSPFAVLQHLFGAGSGADAFIIDVLRLPRMVLALLVGASLGIAGLILQEMVRNPLASPDIIGITSGASVAAVAFIALFTGIISISVLPLVAMMGAGLVSLLIYLLAWKKGVTPIRLVLIGIGMAAAMDALTTMMIVFSPIRTASQAYTWLTGSVYGTTWEDVAAMAPWVLLLMPLAFLCMRAIHVQQLGDGIAVGLGAKIQWQRFLMILISVGLAGVAVAFAGGVGFVGLMAPHIGRFFVGRSFAALVPVSALIGGWMVVVADVIARTAFLPLDLPVGVLISGIGAPFFLYLLYRNRHL
ncbi:iron complex transport system permease protein [Geomicrobium halophilum]|uniref:Iron complex transport system permease protein n=1 Tax=Geomicrobium halophilum TaxID=549000 RepID=A0A841PQK9_9BACL|nr:iron ABC transporter permease [Geomicrobium halophilum]MBB6451070.1 iron complex transport system permease protein [Geomicrobium halophilum]